MHSYLCLFTSAKKRDSQCSATGIRNSSSVCGVLYIRVCGWKLILRIKFSDILQLHFATLVSGPSRFSHSEVNLSQGKSAFVCVCVCGGGGGGCNIKGVL